MSTFDIVYPEERKVGIQLAEEILSAFNTKPINDVDDLIEAVPKLKAVDNLVSAVELAFNDFQLALDDLNVLDDKNIKSTQENLDDAYRKFVGLGCRTYDTIGNPGEGPEAEDDERDDQLEDQIEAPADTR